MSEQEIRAEFIGKRLDGHFRDGETWTVAFSANGRIEHFQNRKNLIPGSWFFRGAVFCSVPDAQFQPRFRIGCWSITRHGSNCYQYFRVDVLGHEPIESGSREREWYALGWRQGEPPTCEERPSV
jgi:hypothetical protein